MLGADAMTDDGVHPAGDMAGWPALPYDEWRDTRDTLHMYTQVVGKLRLALSPFEPEWAHVPLYVTTRGLSSSAIPYGMRTFDVELDLIDHELVMRASDGPVERRPLGGSVAGFYGDVRRALQRFGMAVKISELPSEISDPIPFPNDTEHDTYDRESVQRFHRALTTADLLLKRHRARFRGRTTLVQFFWGTFDLALTRYSGRPVEPPPNAGIIRRVGADAEGICAGWWPGDERSRRACFFAYGYPSPVGIDSMAVWPKAATWSAGAGEFLLAYDDARAAGDPEAAVRDFLESTYNAAARLMQWDSGLTCVADLTASHPHATPREERQMSSCTHLDQINDVAPSGEGCVECLAANRHDWVHLRVCQICGHVGCCDYSPGKHATAHYHSVGDPIIRSFEPGEDWYYCYPDDLMFELEGAPPAPSHA